MHALDRDGSRLLHYGGVFRPSDLALIRGESAHAARGVGLDESDTDEFVLAISEAVANVIKHAGGVGQLTVFVEDSQLIADVTDNGPKFRIGAPEATPAPHDERGRGLWLIRRCVDRLELLSRKVGQRLRLIKFIPTALAAATVAIAVTA